MNATWIVRLTNRIALFFVALLIFWVMIYMVNSIFDLKIFQQHIADAFVMSILAIFAILGSILMLNIMFNLSRIADAKQGINEPNSTQNETVKYFVST